LFDGTESGGDVSADDRGDPATAPKGPSFARDLMALGKPGIVRMCVLMTAGGLWLGSVDHPASAMTWVAGLAGTALAVASANAFNMVWERETDRLMMRTRRRPVADGRVSPHAANAFAVVVGLIGFSLLGFGTNWLTAALAVFALGSYVLVYTPLKRHTPLALVIGAIPGAVPPLLGWTAATGSLDVPGLVLFGILLCWQMPHFIAIALFQQQDYARAGIKVVPIVRGEREAKIQAVAWSLALLLVSITLTPLGVTGMPYLVISGTLGAGFLGWSLTGLRPSLSGSDASDSSARQRWARRFFFASLVYLPALTIALVVDVLV
jgi:protoheme IX farnesyltransferase